MKRVLVVIVSVGALVFSVVAVVGGSPAQQTAFLASDAGINGPTHVATCPVRIDPDCVARAAAAGIAVKTNERLKFPVARVAMLDGGIMIQLPPMQTGVIRECIQVKDWSDCTLATAASDPTAAGKWGQALPFTKTGTVRGCVRRKADAGLPCRFVDGGLPGNRNVFPRALANNPATCESCECSITLGEDPEVDL